MKPIPFNRRAFVKNVVVGSAAAVKGPLSASASQDVLASATASRSRLSPEEQALIKAAVEQRLAAGEHSPL